MKKNIGSFDAGFRFILGCVLLFAGVQWIGWWGLLGLIPWATGALGFCPLYCLLHLDTAAWEARWDQRHPYHRPDSHHHS